ncbi:MAG TPA: hypothetical protein VF590_01775 [Isosphaeraceae bacterium]|jgi:hypothetical protein
MPMLADFALRLAAGLSGLVLLSPWRVVPPAFFRTLCGVTLGVLVLATLELAGAGTDRAYRAAALGGGAAALAFLASACWGLGLVRLGVPLSAGTLAAAAVLLVAASRAPQAGVWGLNAAGRLASAFLLGATLAAMLLGHHYLTAPTMSIAPLRRFVRCMAAALGVRAVLAAVGLVLWASGSVAGARTGAVEPLFLAIRWGMGIVGPALATTLAWKTVQIRSTQSATGILYIAMTLVLFGELTALVLTRDGGIDF